MLADEVQMDEAQAREGLKLKPTWCRYLPEIFIPIIYIAPYNLTANFVGSNIPFI